MLIAAGMLLLSIRGAAAGLAFRLVAKNGLEGNTIDANVTGTTQILLPTSRACVKLPFAAVGKAVETLQHFRT